MGRRAVRAAVTNTISLGEISYVGTVFRARPQVVQEQDYSQTMWGLVINESPNGSSAVIVVNLPGPDKRNRRTLTGRGHNDDTNIHPIVLELWFACVGGDAMDAQDDYDQIVDELTALIRANPSMSAPEAVWSAGEYTAGVVHTQSQALTNDDGTVVFIFGKIAFEAWTWIAKNVVPVD